MVKNLPVNAGNPGAIPELGRSPYTQALISNAYLEESSLGDKLVSG